MTIRKNRLRIVFIIMAVVLLLSSWPLPYYVTMPGMASNVRDYVSVEGAKKDEGSFSFTTVSMKKATVWDLLKAKFTPYYTVEKKEDVMPPGESDEEFTKRQEYYMKSSQDVAILNAYQLVGESVSIKNEGAMVVMVYEDLPAKGKLLTGDRIVKADNRVIQTSEELIAYVNKKQAGEKVNFGYIRDGEREDVTIELVELPTNEKRVGVGMVLETVRKIKEQPKVTFHTEGIGGPSAGLMFTLEILNQLVPEDITKGRKVAGTGEIFDDGRVGPIGGIEQKVVAADQEGMDIFFAPNEQGKERSNYELAIQTAKEIKTDMKIVPVDSLADAFGYLESLK